MIKRLTKLARIHMRGRFIQGQKCWVLYIIGFQHGREDRKPVLEDLGIAESLWHPLTRVPSIDSAASSALSRRTPGRMMREGITKPDTLTATTKDMWKLGLISSVHIVLEPLMPMTVRVVESGVNKVSSMYKTRDESILCSMGSLAIVLNSTSNDDFPTAFRTPSILCAVRGTSTGLRPRKREYHPDVGCADWLALVRFCSAPLIKVARIMIYMGTAGSPTHCMAAIHSTRFLSISAEIAGFVSGHSPSIGIPLYWSFAFLNNVRSGTDDVRATSACDSPRRALSKASAMSCFS